MKFKLAPHYSKLLQTIYKTQIEYRNRPRRWDVQEFGAGTCTQTETSPAFA